MENTNQHLSLGHFRYAKEEAFKNPLAFIRDFCSQITTIELFRQDNLNLFYAACTRMSDHNGKFHKHASEYVYDHRQLIEVIEILWTLYHQESTHLSLSKNHPLYQTSQWKDNGIDLEARLNSPAKYYRKLENQEINDIMLFLKDLFLYRNLDEWRELLDDILSYAYIDESIGSGADISSELIPIAEYLEKIAEAVFLIRDLTAEEKGRIDTIDTSSNDENEDEHYKTLLAELNDPHFTESLIAYLNTFWAHLENENIGHISTLISLPSALEQDLIDYFESFHPKFISRNFRRIYMGYLEHLFETGTPSYYEELRSFTAHMDTFFELLDLADAETAHWPQNNRIGWQED
ncbi:hypothetical protein GCM10023231_05770 [Olivibacter ginsenosidimutans]|uniref:Uncharacterized protein n=1 Tax=Olivibacter ginsenosidimutans TaxID=1176537 RepID=A0ABP9AGS8_9SPHI